MVESDYSHSKDKLVKYTTQSAVHDRHHFGIDIKANEIDLMGEPDYIGVQDGEPGVEYAMANKFIKNLNIMIRSTDAPILIHMKTNGGFWEEGMAIYDAIKACPNEVCILNYTHARSMSSIILQAADRRVMMPHSTFMYHMGTMGYEGTVKQFLTEVEQLKIANEQMLDI